MSQLGKAKAFDMVHLHERAWKDCSRTLDTKYSFVYQRPWNTLQNTKRLWKHCERLEETKKDSDA